MHDPQKKRRLGTVNKIVLRPISPLIGAHSAYMIVCTICTFGEYGTR